MIRTLSLAAALAAATALTPTAFAQTSVETSPQPTTKDRIDSAVATVTGDPLANADLDMKRVLDAMAALEPKDITDLSPEEARRQPSPADGVKALLKAQGKGDGSAADVAAKDIQVDGGAGPIAARVYTPAGAAANLPVVVYYHGGGFVIATIDTYDSSARAIAKMANVIVVSVEYRKAPEHKFLAQGDDAVAAYKWTLANAKSFGGDPAKVAVMFESAGGNLAINVAIAARDQKLQAPVHQVLVYPIAGVNTDTPSYDENEDATPLNKSMMEWFVQQSIRSEADLADPRLDLIGKADLQGLPSATVVTAQIDPLRSDGDMLIEKLKTAGVAVSARNYDGVTHEFFGMGDVVAKAQDAERFVADDLKKAFGS